MNLSISPRSHVNSLFVGWRHSETHRGHHGLITGGIDDFPLGPVGVISQYAFLVFANGNLEELCHGFIAKL